MSKRQFHPISSPRSFELVIRAMRKAIVRGELKPGEKLPSEPELAAQFGVSRSALREALKALEVSGYLDVRRGYGGGTFVSAPEGEEFTTVPPPPIPALKLTPGQLFQVRLAVEPVAARLAVAARLEDVLGLHEAIRHMELYDARPAHVLAAAVNFHLAVARASRNPVFVAIIQGLRPAIYRAMNQLVRDPEWREACRMDHERIAKEIETGDPGRAERAMRRHLLSRGEKRA